MNKDLQVPFNHFGQLGYPIDVDEWKPNYIFEDELQFSHFSRGRSSVKAIFKDENDFKYEMFVSDFNDVINSQTIVKGKIKGRFYFIKKGANYGLKMDC